ncbi:hypothetical protein DINM_022414 [Dirofilaria immitis]|nr:hypothetical protein [Dirofilaria immitis]
MSKAQIGSEKSCNRGRNRYKRGHDSNIDDNEGASSSRYQRTLNDEEQNDFINYQKLSRDIIIECKRIIFQLHRIVTVDTSKGKEELLKEADKRLNEVRNKLFRQMAKELYCLDQYYYIKSYDWALEEYIEALAFYKFLISGEVLLYNEVIEGLQFVDADTEEKKSSLFVELPETTYLMGLFDVGGELMRLAISEISSGNGNTAVNIVNYMRLLHGCYEFLGNIIHTAEWTKKSQVENALYKWKIREIDMPPETANTNSSILI